MKKVVEKIDGWNESVKSDDGWIYRNLDEIDNSLIGWNHSSARELYDIFSDKSLSESLLKSFSLSIMNEEIEVKCYIKKTFPNGSTSVKDCGTVSSD